MAYSTSSPPFILAGQKDFRIWFYRSTDITTDVDGAGYFTNGYDLGIREGDLLCHYKTGTGFYMYQCNSASAAGGVDFANATTITATDSD